MPLARGARSKAISPGFRLLAAFGSVQTDPKQSNSRGTCRGAATNERTMTGTLLAVIARILSGASVRWIDCQPDTCQRVYFANHTSHLDAIVLWSVLPTGLRPLTRPVAAKDYWEKGIVRRYMARTFNALLIDRRDIKVHQSPVDMMLREIGDRQSLIVFPEGSRNTESEIQEFKSGLYYLAKKRPDLELVPVHIDNLNRVLPRGEFLPVPLLSLVTFGPPIWLEAGEPKVEFLDRAREAVRRLKDL
jgi:1-acyl-sn-glycerol-3-phosphate acyltransferase